MILLTIEIPRFSINFPPKFNYQLTKTAYLSLNLYVINAMDRYLSSEGGLQFYHGFTNYYFS
jgi:hypothetical protein